MTILISTIYKGSAVIQAIKLFEPQKVYLIVDDPIDDVRKNTINMMREIFTTLEFIQVPAKIYDIVDIAHATIKTIDSEKGNKIIIHISEGRKTMSLGVLFGAYAVRDKVNSAYYITEEANSPIQIPLVDLKVSTKKQKILESIKQGKNTVNLLEKEMGTSSATLYVQLKELRDDGLLSKNNKLTEMGKIVLLNNRNS